MRTYLDCYPCAGRQVVDAACDLDLDEEVAARLMKRVLSLILEADPALPPPLIGRDLHRMLREETGSADPYLALKCQATRQALDLLPEAERRVAAGADPFHEAVVLSISGNVIDLGTGAGRGIDPRDVLDHALAASVDRSGVAALEHAARAARSVLWLADNAGEIVLDRPLLDRIGPERVTVVVRGRPIINDATLEDAARSGITGRFRVIPNGSDVPGTWLPECSEELRSCFASADVVVAKGQGNYETLSGAPRELFFLLRAKCGPVAQDLGVAPGAFVVRHQSDGSALHSAPR
jgi:damage-control phosphatase, subfamily I